MTDISGAAKIQLAEYEDKPIFYDKSDHRMLAVMEAFKGERPKKILDLGGHHCPINQYINHSPGLVVETADIVGGDHCFDFNMKFPLKNKSYDSVFAGEILEHVLNPPFFMREVARILKPGGLLVLTTPNLASLKNRIQLLLGRQPRFTLHDYTHLHLFVPSALEQLLTEAGLDGIKTYGSGLLFTYPGNPMFLRKIGLYLGMRMPSLALSQVIKARKKEVENL